MLKKIVASLAGLVLLLSSCGVATTPSGEVSSTKSEESQVQASSAQTDEAGGSSILIATTTSTENSGLLEAILPIFKTDTGIEVKVVAVGTGQAIKMGEDGEADALLVHDTAAEEKFVTDGFADKRDNVMYNDFILLGPAGDPDGILSKYKTDITGALKEIAAKNLKFISRGDDSGTHKMELRLWKEAGLETPTGDWYVSVGKGMGETIMMAEEMNSYTLADRATYLSMKEDVTLEIAVEGDNKLFNQYGVLVVNSAANLEGAKAFQEWLLSAKGQKAIGEFGVKKYGAPLFVPNAK